MSIDLNTFFDACDPNKTLIMENAMDRQYYVDFTSVRGGRIIEAIQRTITKLSPHKPTCQLFSGHIGCGKSTELRKLEAELKKEENGFHVVYFESTQDLDMADLDITDIFFAIVRQISASLESIGIKLRPSYFVGLFNEISDFLATPIEFSAEMGLSSPLGKITAKTKEVPKVRSRLRQLLDPKIDNILQAINKEVLGVANEELKKRGKKGLVVIVDNLDRVDPRPKTEGTKRSLPQYLFVDRGAQLRQLNCHVVYTIPLSLIFSNDAQTLAGRLGGGVAPKVLPMVPVYLRNGSKNEEGMQLLRKMVMARAFPDASPDHQTSLAAIKEVFDTIETLDRLCCISGGHVRTLMGLLYRCLQEEDPPLSSDCLKRVIRDHRDSIVLGITEEEWELLHQVVKQQSVSGEDGHETLLRSLFVFEYQDSDGRWFGINPALKETEKYKLWQL